MAKPEQILASLEKLYVRRSGLDKQIVELEKKLVTESKAVKPASPKGVRAKGAKALVKAKTTRKPRTPKV
jgi:hypothetical protein